MATLYMIVTDTSTSITTEPTTRYDNDHPNLTWRRVVIIPIWVVQLGFLAVNAVVAGMLIGITESGSKPGQNEIELWIVVIIFASIALILTCAEVLMFVFHELSRNMSLISTAIKIMMGLILIGIEISVAHTSWAHTSPNMAYLVTAFGFSAIEYVGYIAALVYGLYVARNFRNHMRELYSSYVDDPEATRLTSPYS